MKKIISFLSVILLLMLSAHHSKAQNAFIPCSTGFNADVIADGAGDPALTTDNDCDGSNYVFADNTFNPAGTICATDTTAFPTTVVSKYGFIYSLQAASNGSGGLNSNALRIQTTTTTNNTLTLASPTSLSHLYVLECLGNGGYSTTNTLYAVIHYSDGSSSTQLTNSTLADWTFTTSSNANVILSPYIHAIRNTVACQSGAVNYLSELTFDIPTADLSKSVTSITFTASLAVAKGTVCIFALGGTMNLPCTDPLAQPTSLTFTPGATTVAGSFTPSDADHYLIVRSTSSSLGATPTTGVTYTTGQTFGTGVIVGYQSKATPSVSFTDNGLTIGVHYYYFVFGANSNCLNGPNYLTVSPLTGNTLTFSHDVMVSKIITPSDTVAPSSSQTVSVRIRNKGTIAETNIPIYYQVNSLTPIFAYCTGNLAPGDSTAYTFTIPFTAPTSNFSLCAYTNLTNDINTANDKTCKTVYMIGTGINEKKAALNVKIFPNPAHDKLNINCNSIKKGITTFSIYDTRGVELYKEETNIINDNFNKVINTTNYKSGIYFIKIENESGVYNNKFIIE